MFGIVEYFCDDGWYLMFEMLMAIEVWRELHEI